jgi:uncharacterized protein YchJ
MAQLFKSVAGLRIFSDTIDLDAITRTLGCEPTTSHVKGQVRYKTTLWKTGAWILNASDTQPANLDAQVAEILGRVSSDLKVWSALSGEHSIDLFCGFFMDRGNEDLVISAETMKLLSERGIELEFSIYANMPAIGPTDPCPCDSGKAYAECCGSKSQV